MNSSFSFYPYCFLPKTENGENGLSFKNIRLNVLRISVALLNFVKISSMKYLHSSS